MAKIHFVKSARKDNPVAKKGESYYWWKPMIGGRGGAKRFSKDYPKPSQTTQSDFLASAYAFSESIDAAEDVDAIESEIEAIRDLGNEQQEKLDNMPDGLRDGDTGQLLDERAAGCEEWASNIESAISEYRDKISEIEQAREAWAEYNSKDGFDDDGEELDEPDSDEPDENAEDEAFTELKEEISSNFPF